MNFEIADTLLKVANAEFRFFDVILYGCTASHIDLSSSIKEKVPVFAIYKVVELKDTGVTVGMEPSLLPNFQLDQRGPRNSGKEI
jgi:hypothetical protein